MKIIASLALLFCAACSTTSKTPHVDLMGGVRNFDNSQDWEQTDNQTAFGIQAHFAGKEGFGPEVGFIVSDDTSGDDQYVNRPVNYTQSTINELYAGVRKNWLLTDNVQVFIGGGAAATMLRTTADVTYDDVNHDSRSVAYSPYAQGGVNYLLGDNFTVGIMYRRTFWGEDADAFINEPPSQSNLLVFTLGYSL